jgi:hypothetical protein
MDFPPTEVEMLDGVPVSGLHLAAFVGLPLVLTLVAIVLSKRCFCRSGTERRLNEDRRAGE